jgi:hypothetical protein
MRYERCRRPAHQGQTIGHTRPTTGALPQTPTGAASLSQFAGKATRLAVLETGAGR